MTATEPPPEGRLLRLARDSMLPRGLSMRAAARLAGISETHWRNVESGRESKGGMQIPVRAAPDTLARMARVVGIAPERLRQAGRGDAAEVLDEIISREGDVAAAARRDVPPEYRAILEAEGLTEGEKLAAVAAIEDRRARLAAAGFGERQQDILLRAPAAYKKLMDRKRDRDQADSRGESALPESGQTA